jgi:hypothetical protein
MSFVFSRRSKKNLETCEIPLQTLATKALATSPIDFTIICGYRGKKDQDKAFSSGASKLKFPTANITNGLLLLSMPCLIHSIGMI